jgi:hypothetical protein
MRSWTQDLSPDEARRVFVDHQWAIAGFAVAFVLGLAVLFGVRDEVGVLALVIGLALAFIWGFVFRVWAMSKVRAMHAESPPSNGGQQGGERPGG